jgi:hypothetical protein
LVKALVAIEGRSWGQLTQIKLARMLARIQIRPLPAQFGKALANTNGNGPALSDLRIRQLAEWHEDKAYRHYNPAELTAGKLNSELRAILRQEAGLERVEIEFSRVIKFATRQ